MSSTESGESSRDRYIRLIQRLYAEAYNRGEYEIIEELFGPTYGGVGVAPGDHDPSGPPAGQSTVDKLRTAFPDFSPEIRAVYFDADTVIAHLDVTATHDGPWVLGAEADPFVAEPTGTGIEFEGIRTFRFEDGQVVESHAWGEWLSVLVELGVACDFSQYIHQRSDQ